MIVRKLNGKKKKAESLRYIDDYFGLSKINFENSYGFTINDTNHRVRHAIQAQNVFRHVVRRTENIDMVVNVKKSAMMCVSDALAYEADGYILDEDQERLGFQDRMKALGMIFPNRPNMNLQMERVFGQDTGCCET